MSHPLSQPPPEPGQWPHPGGTPSGTHRGLPGWAKLLIGLGLGAGLLMVLMCGGLLYVGIVSPDTKALAGSQLTRRQLDTIRGLGLLEGGERVKYFYSDGFLSIEEGMYFFTDDKVVVYGKNLDPRAQLVTYDEIVDITADFSDTWLVDGTIWLELSDGSFTAMPISAEAGADQYFFRSLVDTWKISRDTSTAAAESGE